MILYNGKIVVESYLNGHTNSTQNLLFMNSGIDDSLGDDVSSRNLQYKADAENTSSLS